MQNTKYVQNTQRNTSLAQIMNYIMKEKLDIICQVVLRVVILELVRW